MTLKQQSLLHDNFSDWLESIQKFRERIGQDKLPREGNIDPVPILFSPENQTENANVVKIGMEDVQLEIDYWNSTLYCYVVGVNPPIQVMEGFFRRIWRNHGIDKVALVKKGIYVVRFISMEKRDLVLARNPPFFDSKPMILKCCTADVDMCKKDVNVLPIWIQLMLNFK